MKKKIRQKSNIAGETYKRHWHLTMTMYGLHQVHNYSFKWKNYKKLSLTDNSEKTLSNLVCTFFVHKNIECILNKMNNFELKVHFICQWNTAKRIPAWSPIGSLGQSVSFSSIKYDGVRGNECHQVWTITTLQAKKDCRSWKGVNTFHYCSSTNCA